MNSSRLSPFGAAVLVTAATVTAQGTTTATTIHDTVIPGVTVDEGQKRFATPDLSAWANAVPVPMPTVDHPLPEGFVNEAVTFDCRTGVESRIELSSTGSLLVPSGQVAGRVMGAVVAEPLGLMSSPSTINSTAFPWSAQCRLFFNQGTGSFIASGTMIDARTVITAGHCVHEGDGGVWSTNMTVVPAYDGDDDAYGSANSVQMGSYTAWTVNGNFDWDHGHIRVDRPLGFLTSWLGYGWNGSDAFFTGNSWDWAGYPGCPSNCLCAFTGCPTQLYYDFGTIDTVTANRLNSVLTNFCSIGGMSGGGIYWRDTNQNRFVYGVTSTQTWSTVTCTVLSAGFTRLVQSAFDNLNNSFVPAGYGATLDLVPLRCQGAASVPAGGIVGGFNFLVGNMSAADPASASYAFDVYLSSNDNISTADTLLASQSFTWDFAPKSTVTVNSSVRVPQDMPLGNYWLGVITENDADVNNNDTDGWDAHPIAVTRTFGTLPSTSRFVGTGGIVVDFENLTSMPSYMAVNRLHGDTLAFSSEAWANFGLLAPVSNVFRGNASLELGVDPSVASTSPDPIAAFLLRLNGANGANFVLDFEAINFGEEVDSLDGVWISQDGNAWTPLLAPWPSTNGRWRSQRDIQLTGATSVDTDLDFYLAFVVQDNFAYGTADGVGIDDIRVHVVGDLTATLSNFYSPGTAEMHLHSGPASSPIGAWAMSVMGGGPLPSPLGTVLLTPPIVVHDVQLLIGGAATTTWAIPSGFVGTHVWVQGVEVGAAITVTNGVDVLLK